MPACIRTLGVLDTPRETAENQRCIEANGYPNKMSDIIGNHDSAPPESFNCNFRVIIPTLLILFFYNVTLSLGKLCYLTILMKRVTFSTGP